MKIVVLSNTHSNSIESLPKKITEELSNNIDRAEIRSELPEIDTVEAEGFRIGVNHPAEDGSPMTIKQRIRRKFQDVQVIIHVHSHRTKNEKKDGVLWFNPGSATGKFHAIKKSCGILTIDDEIKGENVEL